MGVQIVMDGSGDTRHEFDAGDIASIAEAKHRFEQLTTAGHSAIAFKAAGGPGELIREFDCNVERTVFVPRLVGG